MYIANTHLKPVIGIDIHLVNIPFPFPIPHPYIGLVIDPFDYIPKIGATVKVNNVPRGNSDTAGMLITFIHIPFGAGFTLMPIIGHDSANFFGSKTVHVDGAPMSGTNYFLMTCNDFGLPLSFSPGKKFLPIPSFYLPFSFALPIQWGAPVNVGGPMVHTFSLMALLKAFAMGSVFKILGKLGSKALKALNNKILKKFPSTSKMSDRLCKMGFEPVDLITGRVTYEYVDFELPGPIPIEWKRTWDSDSSIRGLLGHGVQFCYDRCIQLWPEEDALVVTLDDGRLAAFPMLHPGEHYYHVQEQLLLRRKQNGNFILEDYSESLYFHFNHNVQPGIYKLSFIESYHGNRIQFHYNSQYLSAITDSAGRQLMLELDTEHRITKVTVRHRDMERVLVRYQYDEENNLSGIADALDQLTQVTYENHLMVKKTDRNGYSFYWEYDNLGRCVHTWGDNGILEGFIAFHKGYNVVTNATGDSTTYFYDENNLCVQEMDHYGNSKYFEYTEDFYLYRSIDEEGNITGYTYDKKGRMAEELFPDGNSVQYRYNDQNQLTLVVYPGDATDTYGYDEQHRLRFMNYANGETWTYEYNDEGQLTSLYENGSYRAQLQYDEDENLTSVQMPNGQTAYWKYNALGYCIQTTNATGESRQFEYDALERIKKVVLPDGNLVKIAYDAYENATRIEDKHHSIDLAYTPMGNLVKHKQGNQELQFLYDKHERLKAIVNEKGNHFSFSYNHRGELIRETSFDGVERRYERSANGLVLKTLRPGNRFTKFEYNANGKAVRVEYEDGSWAMFDYDKQGRIKEAINEHSTVRLTYGKDGSIIAEDQNGYKVESTFNLQGHRVSLTSSLGANIAFNRNESGQIINMQARVEQLLWQSHFKYNQAGIEIERMLPGGLVSEWKYDHAARPAEQKISRHGIVQSWKKYSWDADDRLSNIFNALTQTNTHFRHNHLGNLVFAQQADNSLLHRMTDTTGNIYETTSMGDRKYNPSGALLESNKYTYQYDEEGYLVSKTAKAAVPNSAGNNKRLQYEWYASGMLRKVTRPDGKTVEFTYDALGRRISKRFNGRITRWVWDGDVPLHEWSYDERSEPRAVVNEWAELIYDREEPNPVNDAGGTQPVTWLFEDGSNSVPCGKMENGKTYSIITDHIGTPKEAYDEQGKRIWEAVVDIYGRVHVITGNKNFVPFRFPGQYEDEETGLYYNRFRYYAPEDGLYISQDPIGLDGNNLSLYGYVKDPNISFDPFGLECWSTARKKFWKNEVKNNPQNYSKRNQKRMAKGQAPKMKVEVFNHKRQRNEKIDVTMEIHHTYLPQRMGTPKAHETWNLTKAAPWAHAGMDPYRHTGYDLIRIIKGPKTW